MIARFGTYEIDTDKVEIRRDGRAVAVQPQVFSVIEYLLAERERVVPKEELLDNIWGDRFVSESALTSRIKSARKALGDSGAEQSVIRTVVGRGYRFVADITDTPSAELSSSSSQSPESTPAAPSLGSTAADINDTPSTELSSSTSQSPESTPAEASPATTASPEADPGSPLTAFTGEPHPPIAVEWPLIGRHNQIGLISAFAADASVPGVTLSGPADVGATRLAEACRDALGAAGNPTAWVVGTSAASDLPFAAVAHLLPNESLVPPEASSDFARSEALQRARRHIEAASDRRRVLLIENAHALDQMSVALISSLMTAGTVFAIFVRTAIDQADEYSRIRDIAVPPLTSIETDILLHRVLGGPVTPATLREIEAISGGLPGVIRDLVETSLQLGTLIADHGVWKSSGPLTTSTQRNWNPDALSDAALHAAQVLSLLPWLTERAVALTVDEAGLDELDHLHLLNVARHGSDMRVSLTDPLLAQVVRDQISPLLEQRLKRQLAETLLETDAAPSIVRTIAGWDVGEHHAVSDAVLLRAAQTAMIEGEMETAGDLVEAMTDPNTPNAKLIAAEVALQRSQWSRAEQLFESVDVTALDEVSASHVLRRTAAIQFYSRSIFDDTINWLEAEAQQHGSRIARSLMARRVGMLAYLGRVDETLAAAHQLGPLKGLTAIEVLLSTASANFHRGAFVQALDIVDEVDSLLDQVPPAWAAEPQDGAVTIRSSVLLHLGRIDEAAALVRSSLPMGERTELGYFPSLAAAVELMAGRPRAAHELLRPAVESSHRDAFPHYLCVALGLMAQAEHAIGRQEHARDMLAKASAASKRLAGELRWLAEVSIATVSRDLGMAQSPAPLLAFADEAASMGAHMREADLLVSAALLDDTRELAARVLGRVTERVALFDGEFWPLRLRHLEAFASDQPLEPINNAYRSLGYPGLASQPALAR